MRNEAAIFLLALQFLTRVPINTERLYSPQRLTAAVRYYPLVGVMIGAAMAFVYACASLVLPTTVAVTLCLVSGLLLTGAFHEDGLADTFDGLGGGASRDRALDIMRDSRIGTYGTLALISSLLLKLATLTEMPATWTIAALIAGGGLSRLSSVAVIASSRYVRDEGTGKPVAAGVATTSLITAGITGVIIAGIWWAVLPIAGFAAGVLGLLVGHALMRGLFESTLGGYTGDTLGAVQQCSEIGFLVGVLAWL